ncbi:hypothetical protein KEM52_002639 [Ascosphaera acerosa]|nr:hypothetical protein KEM52_002639 [Ascosphaera acerosa]
MPFASTALKLLTVALLVPSSLANPVPAAAPAPAAQDIQQRDDSLDRLTAALKIIAPNSVYCDTVLPGADQCRTAAQAAGPIKRSWEKYGLQYRGERAAVVAVMAYESVDFRYAVNQAHPDIGQGTRNMQSPAFNRLYALSIPEIAATVNSTTPSQLLDTLNSNDDWSFGSAAWFLTTQCDAKTRAAVANANRFETEPFIAYVRDCLGVKGADLEAEKEERVRDWKAAMEALIERDL